MKKLLWPGVSLLLCAAVLFGSAAQAADSTTTMATSTNSIASSPKKSVKSTPGVEAAQAISTITGVAISPLLGVGGVGVWKYYKTPPEKRAKLAWYAQPWFWVPALLLVSLAFVKDTFGTALPTVVKKPFDVAEAIENKISGLVAAGAFVPLIATIFSSIGADDSTLYGDAGMAFIDVGALLNVLTLPFAIIAFVVVWMVSHVINVLIIVSPFSTVDAALKSFRLFMLSTVAGTAFVNPYVGAAWSLVIILVCLFLAGWSYRMMTFGAVLTWDTISFRSNRFNVQAESNSVFTACEIEKTPIRTYGRLSRGPQGELMLSYRPWLLLPRRTLTLPAGKYAVGRGLFYSEIIKVEGEDLTAMLTLPPRFRSHEAELNSTYKLSGVHDVGVVRGLKAVWKWMMGNEELAAA